MMVHVKTAPTILDHKVTEKNVVLTNAISKISCLKMESVPSATPTREDKTMQKIVGQINAIQSKNL